MTRGRQAGGESAAAHPSSSSPPSSPCTRTQTQTQTQTHTHHHHRLHHFFHGLRLSAHGTAFLKPRHRLFLVRLLKVHTHDVDCRKFLFAELTPPLLLAHLCKCVCVCVCVCARARNLSLFLSSSLSLSFSLSLFARQPRPHGHAISVFRSGHAISVYRLEGTEGIDGKVQPQEDFYRH